MHRARWVIGIAVLAVVAWFGWINAHGRADDKFASDKPATDTAATDKVRAEPASPVDETSTVPHGSVEELLAFIDKVRGEKAPQEEAEFKAFVSKTRKSIVDAADKILADKPDSKDRRSAVEAKIDALAALKFLCDDEQAGKQLESLLNDLQKDKDSKVVDLVKQFRLNLEMHDLMEGNGNPEEAQKLWDDAKAKLVAAPDERANIQFALTVAGALSHSNDTKLAIQAYRDLGKILAKSDDPRIADQIKQFEGTIRRLSLPDHSLELKLTATDGHPVDLDSLKGKVVLVDFWATWCGPCMAELPNVKKNYDKYHAKGFEVVGISMDDEREALDAVVTDKQIPWPIVFGKEGQLFAEHYGIGPIPTTILIDQKGVVVSLSARGKKLGQLLEQLLGKN